MEDVISLPSFTSRNPRPGEEEGVQYHFVTKEQFEEKIKNNEFYEYDLHHENYYGTSRKLMNEKIQSGKIIVKDIEVNGTENLIKMLKNDTKIIPIFLRVDKEELRRRLENRGDNLTEEEMQIRLGRLEYEESKMNLYDYVIKNDDLEKTVQIIQTIIENEKRIEKLNSNN
jgi:guanylate kinase